MAKLLALLMLCVLPVVLADNAQCFSNECGPLEFCCGPHECCLKDCSSTNCAVDQYCCGNEKCCHHECHSEFCDPRNEYCCGENKCCAFKCAGGCDDDHFCCGTNLCCANQLWYSFWWIWAISSFAFLLLLSSCIAVCCRACCSRKPNEVVIYRADANPYNRFENELKTCTEHY
ncbi:keratin-associated protein 4-5-like [Anneissia japonica]|uniref:keratin-associated protein 4-5-like n=1 Tax=Anneissia japonica TaxID=1529436 RepID=UPI00142578BC|nr:keratin-associated protein 4-5-like [Anneissia japonica]